MPRRRPDRVHRPAGPPDRDRAGRPPGGTLLGGGAPVLPELIRRMESGFGAQFINHLRRRPRLHPVVTHGPAADDSPDDKARRPWARRSPRSSARLIHPADRRGRRLGEQGEFCARGFSTMIGLLRHDRRPRRPPSTPTAGCAPATCARWTSAATCRHRPPQGHDHPRRRERLPGGDRGAVLAHPAGRRRRRHRPPDDHWGEVVAAVVRPRRPRRRRRSPSCASHAARRARATRSPTRGSSRDGFPLDRAGKVQKFVLRGGRARSVAGARPVAIKRTGGFRAVFDTDFRTGSSSELGGQGDSRSRQTAACSTRCRAWNTSRA